MDLGSEELHPVDVQQLPLHVLRAHEDLALQAEICGHGGCGDAVLARAGLRYHAGLAHPLGQQALADDVVDLVGPCVVQVLPLDVDLGPAQVLGHPLGEIERRGPSCVLAVEPLHLRHELRVAAVLRICFLQLDDRVHQGFGDVLPSELPVPSFLSLHWNRCCMRADNNSDVRKQSRRNLRAHSSHRNGELWRRVRPTPGSISMADTTNCLHI